LSGIPYSWQEGLLILASVSALMAIIISLFSTRRIGITRELSFGIIKGGVQLFTLAIFLTYLFASPNWYILIWLLLGGMVLLGGYTSARRATGMPSPSTITTPAILIGSAITLSVLAATRAMPLEPQFIVPLSGMVFGNSMNICSLSLDRLMREMRLNSQVIETMLSLGANTNQALAPFSKEATRAALIPTIDRIKTLGIIFIPGAMAGLLMAGTYPLLAAEYQIIVYMMIIGSGLITTMAVSALARKHVFTQAAQLQEWLLAPEKS
jgi:putative ABC transport system permease protein